MVAVVPITGIIVVRAAAAVGIGIHRNAADRRSECALNGAKMDDRVLAVTIRTERMPAAEAAGAAAACRIMSLRCTAADMAAVVATVDIVRCMHG